jgi:ATP-dependent Clp protease ATP-binding subunit ClpX
MVRRRVGERGIGFGAVVDPKMEDRNALRAQVMHEDLLKYAMIPEFVGRIPIVVACDDLDVDSLVEILWKPKNALVRQYQRLFQMEGVRLRVSDGAMRALADEAFKRKSGARGLRAILEEVMLDVMYEIPSMEGILECVIDENTIVKRDRPKLIREKKAS